MKATEIINHFDLPSELTGITGTFRYRFFDPLEKVEEDSRFANNGEDVPRYIRLDWTGINDPISVDLQGQEMIHRQNLFFPSDLNSGFTSLTTSEEEALDKQAHVTSDNTSESSRLDYLLNAVVSNKYTEALEQNIGHSRSVIPVLDPTSNTPVVGKKITYNPDQAPDILIKSSELYSCIRKSIASPLSAGTYDNFDRVSETISTKATSDIEERSNKRLLTTFKNSIETLASPNAKGEFIAKLFNISRDTNNASLLENWQLVGYFISKYRIQGTQETYMYSRIAYNKFYEDPYVAYGKSYRYEIRPIFCKYISANSSSVIFLCSDESSFIDVQCEEKKCPSPPKNLRFEYIGNENIEISWERPESLVSDKGKIYDSDDIKGYQLFYRHSLNSPYELYRYFTFNNTMPQKFVSRSAELISDDLIISSEYSPAGELDPNNLPVFFEPKRYIFKIRPNTDYFFAMCSIDAHGNSSNYSVQYKARRNNVTGEVDIQLVSSEGAPKQYPNLLVKGKLVDSSIKVSGYRYLDIYLNPDTQMSMPNRNTAGTRLQLFDLETQIEKNITITINET